MRAAARAAGRQRLLRLACLAMACSNCTAMRAGCLGQRSLRMPRCTARSPWPLCLSETGSLVDDGDEEAQWRDDDDGDDDEEEEDDGVESVVAYLPQLLEVKYGKDWESLMGASPDDEDEEEEGGMDDRWDFTNEEEGSIKEEELRWLVMQQLSLIHI